MLTSMQSNDAFLGLPHDVFAFTLLQEILARSLTLELGSYKHSVGSLHLYNKHFEQVAQYLDEGWHEKVLMPAMPTEDPWPSIQILLRAECDLREGRPLDVGQLKLAPYWLDLVRLLEVYRHFKNTQVPEVDADKEFAAIDGIKKMMSTRMYDPYIDKKKTRAKPPSSVSRPGQLFLFGGRS